MQLKKFRKAQNITVKEMAEILEVTESHYYKLEEGHKKPSYEFMKRFKEKFNERIDKVFFK